MTYFFCCDLESLFFVLFCTNFSMFENILNYIGTNLMTCEEGVISTTDRDRAMQAFFTVSYTHLTLPTIYSV